MSNQFETNEWIGQGYTNILFLYCYILYGSKYKTVYILWSPTSWIPITSKSISDWEHILYKCSDKNWLAAGLYQQPRGIYGLLTMPDTTVTAVVDSCHHRHRHMLCSPHRTFNSNSCKIWHLIKNILIIDQRPGLLSKIHVKFYDS